MHEKSPQRPLLLALAEAAEEKYHAYQVFETSEHDVKI